MPPNLSLLTRRQWLQSAAAALVGLFIARHLPGAEPANSSVRPAAAVKAKSERYYIHGFEADPGA